METQMVNQHKKVKIEMIRKGVNPSEVAREVGVTRWAVYAVMTGRSRSARIRLAIAEKLGTTPGRLWRKGI
jgi:hypothetical protein